MAMQHGLLLAVSLIKDHFGDIVSKVCDCLLRKGSLTLQEISRDTGLASAQVKNCLLVLIQHNCVQAFFVPRSVEPGADDRGVTLYMALFDNVIHRMRFSKFLSIVADDLGTQCEVLLEGLLQHGRLTFEQLIERATSKQGSVSDRDALLASFNQLVQAQYVERCPKPEPFIAPTNNEASKKHAKTALTKTLEKQALEAATPIDAERFSGIMNVDENADTSSEANLNVGDKRKFEALEMDRKTEASIIEKEVLWRANFEKFIYFLRKKTCVTFKKASLCLDAGVVLEAMIDSCDVKQLKRNTVSSSLDCIFERLIANPQGHIMNRQHVRAILEELGCESSVKDLSVFYTIDLKEIIKDCQISEVESTVLKRYGKDAYRIFRLLVTKNQAIETDKISDMTFVEKNEARILLYKLWKGNILLMEKMVSQETRRTYFVWKVNRNSMWENILDDMYHAAFNLNQRIAYNYEQEKEVADLPVNAMTAIQKQKYSRYGNRKKILEYSLLKLDDVLMLFHDFEVT